MSAPVGFVEALTEAAHQRSETLNQHQLAHDLTSAEQMQTPVCNINSSSSIKLLNI